MRSTVWPAVADDKGAGSHMSTSNSGTEAEEKAPRRGKLDGPEVQHGVAIIGMACLFPGAPNLDVYWRNILGKVDAVTDPPPEAWDTDVYYEPDSAETDKVLDAYARGYRGDANDVLYAIEASRDYDPAPGLEKITAPLMAVNFADDLINPPELGIFEKETARVKNACAITVPATRSS